MGDCNTHIPDERFDHYGVASSGEACDALPLDHAAPASHARRYVRGLLVKENLPRFGEGDRVGFMINFARTQVHNPPPCSFPVPLSPLAACLVPAVCIMPCNLLPAPDFSVTTGHLLPQRQAYCGVQRPAATRGLLGQLRVRGVWLPRQHQPRASTAPRYHALERGRGAAVQVNMPPAFAREAS